MTKKINETAWSTIAEIIPLAEKSAAGKTAATYFNMDVEEIVMEIILNLCEGNSKKWQAAAEKGDKKTVLIGVEQKLRQRLTAERVRSVNLLTETGELDGMTIHKKLDRGMRARFTKKYRLSGVLYRYILASRESDDNIPRDILSVTSAVRSEMNSLSPAVRAKMFAEAEAGIKLKTTAERRALIAAQGDGGWYRTAWARLFHVVEAESIVGF